MRKAKLVYRELATAKVSVTVTCILAKIQRQGEEWESFTGEKKERLQVYHD